MALSSGTDLKTCSTLSTTIFCPIKNTLNVNYIVDFSFVNSRVYIVFRLNLKLLEVILI